VGLGLIEMPRADSHHSIWFDMGKNQESCLTSLHMIWMEKNQES